MNRRLFLNIIIVSIITFYFIFSVVFRNISGESEPATVRNVAPAWTTERLIPQGWQVWRLEFPHGTFILADTQQWQYQAQAVSDIQALIPANWQGMAMADSSAYDGVPEGQTVLVFVSDQSQPLVFRYVSTDSQLIIYRLNDQQRFVIPKAMQTVLIPD